jgi:two-component system, OmpR family, response regulator
VRRPGSRPFKGTAMSIRKCQSVLYVDDDPDICEVVHATLRVIAGLNVHTAGSGEAAIELACELRPDLILMDVMMPGLDGPATLKRMRESTRISEIPVIFLTAKVLPAEVAHFFLLGAIGVIGKPFDPLKLGDEILSLWKGSNAARRTPAMSDGHAHVDAQFSSLANGFLLRTKVDIHRLRKLLDLAGNGDQTVLKESERITHSIHGAGAMFGFPELSAAAGVIERLVEELAATAPYPSGGPAMVQLSDYMQQLAQALEAAGRTALANNGIFQERRRER